MLEDVLRQGFAAAHRRLGLVFLDILWKMIWLAATAAAFILVAAWFSSNLRALAWEDTGVSALNAWIATTVLRELWSAHRAEVLGTLSGLLLLSCFGWLFLEAFCRSRILDQRDTRIFFVSGATKTATLTALAILLIPVWRGGAAVLAIVIFIALAFFLTVLDTLIRADAVELLGTDLIRVAGLIGILMSFEMLIGGSFVVIIIAGFFNVAAASEAVAMLGVTAVAAVCLTLLHSYLLLVRFSAVDIMRRNVVEV